MTAFMRDPPGGDAHKALEDFLEARGESWGVMTRTGHPQWFRWLTNHPWPVYALMLVAFAIGSVAFAIVEFRYLPRSGPPS